MAIGLGIFAGTRELSPWLHELRGVLTSNHQASGFPHENHITLDPDVAAKAKEGAANLGKPFKEVINAALRVGLDEILAPPAAKPTLDKGFFEGTRWKLKCTRQGNLP